MASWVFVLAQADGTTLCELPTATGKKLSFQRNAPAEVEFSISHADDAAYTLLDHLTRGWPTLRCYRDGVLRFNGYLAPFTEELEESAMLHLRFRSPFGKLLGDGENRGRFTGEFVDYVADAGAIALALIDIANTDELTGLSVDAGDVVATVTREQTYEYANIGEAIISLTQMLDGFDFEEVFVENGEVLAEFHVYARMGSEVDARFEYGPATLANCRGVSRATSQPANGVRVIGATGLVSVLGATNNYGQWFYQLSATNIEEQESLDNKAYGVLRPDPIRTLSFTPEYGLDNCPKPWDDFWIGDTVQFYGRRDSFEEDTSLRVNAITVVVDDNGNETAEIPDPLTPGEEAALRATLEGEVMPTD